MSKKVKSVWGRFAYPLLEAYPKLNLGKRFTEALLKVICPTVKIPFPFQLLPDE